MFIAKIVGKSDGCKHHDIACNQTLWYLPDIIQTMEEATEWIKSSQGPFDYYGAEVIASIHIYEVKNHHVFDVKGWIEAFKQKQEKRKAAEQETVERKEFERLKQKYSE